MNIWKLLAGVAIFLLGMKFLEESLQQLAGRPFKLFLRKQTSSKPKAVLGGALVTGILQSSSVVNLMILAFVGANVIEMQNALAVILGTNLGTTLDSWIVATIGFNLNIENIAFPLTGVFGIIMMLSNKETKWYNWSKFLFGFGFLFVGLNYMKTGMEDVVKQTDLSLFAQSPAIVFLLLGFVFTSLIQSSFATIAIVLSALHANAFSLYAATAIVLGSEVGTTIKLVLASLKSHAVKKRVALGNFLFNVITITLVFIFLTPVNYFIKNIVQLKDDLLALVFFQTLVNVLGIILFYPFLNMFGKFLQKRFVSADDNTVFIHKVNAADTEIALVALENEVRYTILLTIHFIREVFEQPDDELLKNALRNNHNQKNLSDSYEYLKHLFGETNGFAIRLQKKTSDQDMIQRIGQLIAANRNSLYAVKSIKDALPDINQLRNSSNDIKFEFYKMAAAKVIVFCSRITKMLLQPKQESSFEDLNELYQSVTMSYSIMLKQLYNEKINQDLTEIEISTLINFNREMYTAYKSFVFALKDLLLAPKEANWFDELPGFIR